MKMFITLNIGVILLEARLVCIFHAHLNWDIRISISVNVPVIYDVFGKCTYFH